MRAMEIIELTVAMILIFWLPIILIAIFVGTSIYQLFSIILDDEKRK